MMMMMVMMMMVMVMVVVVMMMMRLKLLLLLQGYSADWNALTADSGGAKTLMYNAMGPGCLNACVAELLRSEKGCDGPPAQLVDALSYLVRGADGDIAGVTSSGSWAWIGNRLIEHPTLYHFKFFWGESEEFVSCAASPRTACLARVAPPPLLVCVTLV